MQRTVSPAPTHDIIMTESWRQFPLHLMLAHTLWNSLNRIHLCFPQDLFLSSSHTFFLLSVFTPKFWVKCTDVKVKTVNCTETASLLPPVALILSFPSRPPEAVLFVPLWCLRQACKSAAATVKNHETVTDDSLSTRCLNQGQSAFFLLSLSPDTHTKQLVGRKSNL